jgi:hypothetical protein
MLNGLDQICPYPIIFFFLLVTIFFWGNECQFHLAFTTLKELLPTYQPIINVGQSTLDKYF